MLENFTERLWQKWKWLGWKAAFFSKFHHLKCACSILKYPCSSKDKFTKHKAVYNSLLSCLSFKDCFRLSSILIFVHLFYLSVIVQPVVQVPLRQPTIHHKKLLTAIPIVTWQRYHLNTRQEKLTQVNTNLQSHTPVKL